MDFRKNAELTSSAFRCPLFQLIWFSFDDIGCASLEPPWMTHNQAVEAIAQEIEQHAVKAGHALADYLAQHFVDGLMEIDFERHRIANFIFDRTATEVLARFPLLSEADQLTLRNRAIATIRTAFKMRLAKLNYGEA